MRRVPLLTALILLIAGPVLAAAIDLGPAVGARVPALHVTDLDGRPTDLQRLTGPKGAVVFFFRSAKWCPYCQTQLQAFRDAQAPLAQRGYSLVGISYDAPETLKAYATAKGIGYALVSDQGSVTIDAFGLRDPQYRQVAFAWGVPQPIIFVLSPKGVVRAKLAEDGYKVRPTVAAVLTAVDGAGR